MNYVHIHAHTMRRRCDSSDYFVPTARARARADASASALQMHPPIEHTSRQHKQARKKMGACGKKWVGAPKGFGIMQPAFAVQNKTKQITRKLSVEGQLAGPVGHTCGRLQKKSHLTSLTCGSLLGINRDAGRDRSLELWIDLQISMTCMHWPR